MKRLLGMLLAGACALAQAQVRESPTAPVAVTAAAVSAEAALDPAVRQRILALPRGKRPDPSTYLSPGYISTHLAQFDAGACRFMRDGQARKYGIGQSDGTAFVIPCGEAERLLQAGGGDRRRLEGALGLPAHALDNDQLILIKIAHPRAMHLRIPSGNEAGANAQWLPGGRLPGNNREAVVDVAAELARDFDVVTVALP